MTARRPDLTRTDLGLVRTCLAEIDAGSSMYAVARIHHVDRTTLMRWKRARAARGGEWPTEADVHAQRAYLAETAERRRRTQRRNVLGEYRTVDSIGAARRMQALIAMGYRLQDLAPLLGVSKSRVHQIASYQNWRILLDTDAAVRALYTRLNAVPAPRAGRSEAWLRRHARMAYRNNWAPPLAWTSEEAMDDPNEQPNWGWVRAAEEDAA